MPGERIWKFELIAGSGPWDAIASMPIGARVLSAHFQGADLMVWAVCSPGVPYETRVFQVVGTGADLPSGLGAFVGTTFHPAGLVFHVFEVARG